VSVDTSLNVVPGSMADCLNLLRLATDAAGKRIVVSESEMMHDEIQVHVFWVVEKTGAGWL